MTTKYVDIPGIIEVRSVSDDPEHFEPPKDLFDLQSDGLSVASYGKKNRATTEQVFFNCLLCDCDLKSEVTLKAHCRGTQHLKKSRQKMFEWKREHKIKSVKGKFAGFSKRSAVAGDNEDFGGHSKGFKEEVGCSRLDDGVTDIVKVETFRKRSVVVARDNEDVGGQIKSIKEEARSSRYSSNTAMAKVDADVNVTSTRKNNQPQLCTTLTTSCERSESDDVERLHLRMANRVMHCLNKYYVESENSDPAQHKIMSKHEYEKLAREFSHQLREKIKESYYAYHSTLKGVELTADHAEVIRVEVARFFEKSKNV